jgi:Predicted membrane protein
MLIQAYKEYWENMTIINASARRGQYWWPQLINFCLIAAYAIGFRIHRYVDFANDTTIIKEWNMITIIFVLLNLLIWLANFTVRARRLHDRNHSNWWILLYLLPFVGYLIILVTLILPSKPSTKWPVNQTEI